MRASWCCAWTDSAGTSSCRKTKTDDVNNVCTQKRDKEAGIREAAQQKKKRKAPEILLFFFLCCLFLASLLSFSICWRSGWGSVVRSFRLFVALAGWLLCVVICFPSLMLSSFMLFRVVFILSLLFAPSSDRCVLLDPLAASFRSLLFVFSDSQLAQLLVCGLWTIQTTPHTYCRCTIVPSLTLSLLHGYPYIHPFINK